MDAMKFVQKIREGIALVLKCLGLALAVSVFVCMVLETMQTPEAVKLLSLAVACLGVGALSDIHTSTDKKGGREE